jgi:superfamily II DNA or RNA helicase
MIQLRDYQRESVDAIYRHFEARADNPLIVIPTGGGKSAVIATFIREAIETYPGTRVLCLVHVREVVQQNLATLLRLWPEPPASVYSASLGRKDLTGQIVFASTQSIYKRGRDMQPVDLVIVDKAHLIPHKDERQPPARLAACLGLRRASLGMAAPTGQTAVCRPIASLDFSASTRTLRSDCENELCTAITD